MFRGVEVVASAQIDDKTTFLDILFIKIQTTLAFVMYYELISNLN